MAFTDDGGGFSFSCDDAKLSIAASTWNTNLSQLGRMAGALQIVTRRLPNVDYIGRILSKRPQNVFILPSTEAEADARKLKAMFPAIRVALHPNLNAKAVLLEPETVWIGSADFGESDQIESAIGLHSKAVYDRTVLTLFRPAWEKAREI